MNSLPEPQPQPRSNPPSPHLAQARDPRKLYPSTLALGRPTPTPLHRRGTSSKYESLEELLLEHGYKDVRVVTPLVERERHRLAGEARKTSLASLLVGSGAGRQSRAGGVVFDAYGPGHAHTAVDLLRSIASGFTLPEPPQPQYQPSPAPSTSYAPPSPTPPSRSRSRFAQNGNSSGTGNGLPRTTPTRPTTTTKPLAFLTTDPYARTSPPHPTSKPKSPALLHPQPQLHHARSTPHLRRPLTPVTNRSSHSGRSANTYNLGSSNPPATPTLSTPKPAWPVITPTRVQCRSHSHSHARPARPARSPRSTAPPSPSSPLLLAPSPHSSPTIATRSLTSRNRLKPPIPNGPSVPSRHKSIRSLRAHLAAAAAFASGAASGSRVRDKSGERGTGTETGNGRGRSESPEPDFSDPGMLREGSMLDGFDGNAEGGGEGEDTLMQDVGAELLWGNVVSGTLGSKRKRNEGNGSRKGLPGGWGWG